MESIEKLREFVGKELYEKERIGHGDYSHLHVLIEDVKSEIAERYMELPVDADGVPIRVGDIVQQSNGWKKEVLGIGAGCFYDRHYLDDYHKHYAVECSHIKKDPVKELLEEFATDLENYKRDGVDFDCFVERIREAVEK